MTDAEKLPTPFARGGSFWLVAPYAAWMALMAALPQTALFYAVRGAASGALLVASAARLGLGPRRILSRCTPKAVLAGIAVGVAVFFVWIAPEMWLGAGTPVPAADSPYSPEVCGWPLTLAKVAASALVIPAAEELFFRRWLVAFAGFWWMVALFAVEHGDRWHVGALAGIAYGLLARRFGLASAIVAHAVTNLAIGILAVYGGRWQFW